MGRYEMDHMAADRADKANAAEARTKLSIARYLASKLVKCSTCGATWQDSHPDAPGAEIWCGNCDRTATIRLPCKAVPADGPIPFTFTDGTAE